jgi:hypothetical protein
MVWLPSRETMIKVAPWPPPPHDYQKKGFVIVTAYAVVIRIRLDLLNPPHRVQCIHAAWKTEALVPTWI